MNALPAWHRSRLRWLNGLGFAITFFLALWFLAAVISSLRGDADPSKMPYPAAYVAVSVLALVATIGLLVFSTKMLIDVFFKQCIIFFSR